MIARSQQHRVAGRTGRVLAALLGAALVVPTLAAPAAAASSKVTWTTARVVAWVDGDTVLTTKGTVRVIGVDTPEVGVCGSEQATALAQAAAPPGTVVRLGNPRSVMNKDKYRRHLRYVVRKATKVDISVLQISNGAKARYDRLDGYQWHPRQTRYRNLDAATADYQCAEPAPAPIQPVVTPVEPAPTPLPETNPYQERANQPVSASNPDLDCGGDRSTGSRGRGTAPRRGC